jgi:uncharacterized membrane protein YdjX (TVP38/TMEM64 family)
VRLSTQQAVRVAKVVLVVVVLAAVVVAVRSGVFAQVSDPRSFARSVVALGAWGYAGFVVAYALLQPIGVPGTAFIVAAPLIWPWHVAFGLSMTGTMLASVIGFWLARFVGREWVASRIPPRLRKYDDALERNAFQTVFILRLLFWMPQWLHAFFGVSKVGFWTHFWGSLLGYVPPLLLVSYMGAEIFGEDGSLQPRAWVMMGVLLVASLLLAAILRWRARRSLPSGSQ